MRDRYGQVKKRKMENPFKIFEDWYSEQLETSKAKIPSACCFTTIGEDGYPNSRFVSLKDVKNESFIITGSLNSRKGNDVKMNPKVSITFWWNETEKQIRVQGKAEKIKETEAVKYFSKRNKASKIVSTIFEQGKDIKSFKELSTRFENGKLKYENIILDKPKEWSGFYIKPLRIEFLQFMKTRLHKRILFNRRNNEWEKMYLQP